MKIPSPWLLCRYIYWQSRWWFLETFFGYQKLIRLEEVTGHQPHESTYKDVASTPAAHEELPRCPRNQNMSFDNFAEICGGGWQNAKQAMWAYVEGDPVPEACREWTKEDWEWVLEMYYVPVTHLTDLLVRYRSQPQSSQLIERLDRLENRLTRRVPVDWR